MKREINKTDRIKMLGLAAFALAVMLLPTMTYAQKFTPDGRQLVVTIKDGPPAGLLPGQFLRFNLYNPAASGTPAAKGHVKVFDGRGVLIAQTIDIEIAAGCFQSIDISRESLNLPGDPNTGRLQVRAEVEISLWQELTLRGEPAPVEFPTTYELVDRESGRTVMVGHLLPAIQKVR